MWNTRTPPHPTPPLPPSISLHFHFQAHSVYTLHFARLFKNLTLLYITQFRLSKGTDSPCLTLCSPALATIMWRGNVRWGCSCSCLCHTVTHPPLHHSESTNKTLALLSRVKMSLCCMLCHRFTYFPHNLSIWNLLKAELNHLLYIAESWAAVTPNRNLKLFPHK